MLKKVSFDFKNSVFSYIPNSASTAYYGLLDGINEHLNNWKIAEIAKLGANVAPEKISEIVSVLPRLEKLLIKDAKMRTFITQGKDRDDLVGEAYDVTYGLVKNEQDTLVVMDDSVVRGTTLKKSILRILDRLHPKHIVIVSSAPIIKYPDCYGIDMSRFNEFVAYKALVSLLKKNNLEHKITETYEECKRLIVLPGNEIRNAVKDLYDLYNR